MKFLTVTDESNVAHKILVLPLTEKEMLQLVGECNKCLPSISISSIVQVGHVYVIISFGDGGWRTAIPLDQASEDGHKIGDELAVGDVLTVMLTSDAKAVQVSGEKAYMNVPLESVLAFSFLYTAEMAENYALFKMVKQPKAQ